MAAHRIRIDYDEATNALTISHYCTVSLTKHDVRWSETVELADPNALVETLKAMIDVNRAEVEHRAVESAIRHVSAVTGRPQRNTRTQEMGGEMGAAGEEGS